MAKAVSTFDRSIASIERVADKAAIIGGGLIFISSVFVAIEVFLRNVFNVSLQGVDELTGYAFAIACSWSFASTMLRRGNVRIDVLYPYFSQRIQALVDIISLSVLLFFLGGLTWHAAEVVHTSVLFNARATTPLQTPLWIPQGLWFLGLLFVFAVSIAILIRTSMGFLSGDMQTVQRLAGIPSAEDAVEEEVSTLVAAPARTQAGQLP